MEEPQDSRWKKGQSGNPNGRAAGSRNRTTLALETLLDGQATALTQKAIELALAGDMAALRLCLDRIMPPRRDRPVNFELPLIESAQDGAATVSAVLAAVAAGDLTPADAGEISKLIETYVRAFETAELAERLERLATDVDAVIARNLETRIVKLEASRRRPGELLVVWRRPGGDVKAAVSEAKFVRGDRVICLEWFGDGPLPAPRWHEKGLNFSGVEDGYLEQAITRRIESRESDHQREPGFAELPHFPADRMHELSNNDLLHMLFGVAT